MVRKTFHRGVHSGNTLRAFNSGYIRRYHGQACIVCRVRAELLQKLEGRTNEPEQKADDRNRKFPVPHNRAVDVALSLNKQSRWLLPSALIRQIQTDNIADPELRVSVLECHKLKRAINCVSFHSNTGKVRRIQAKNGRYFGFCFPAADGKSRRTVRRELREQMDKVNRYLANKNEGKKPVGKIIQVATKQGKVQGLGESEVQYEVYYPSPANSSISHNAKYIKQDVDAAFKDREEHVQNGRSRKQHRGRRRERVTLGDIDDWKLTSCHRQPSQTPTTTLTIVNQKESSLLCDVKEEGNPTECLLTSLIEKAQQLQVLKGNAKLRCRKTKAPMHKECDKSHIVFLGETRDYFAEDEEDDESPPRRIPPVPPIPSESTRVLLPKDEVTFASLKDHFGESYSEIGCKPRKFVLDITSSVRKLLKKQGIQAKVAEQTEEALSYLICVHDGVYNDEYHVYKVLLNSKLHEGLVAVEIHAQEQAELFRGTVINLISQVMNFIQGQVVILKEKKYFPLFVEDQPAKVSPRRLYKHLGSSESYVPSVKRVVQKGSAISDTTVAMPSMSDVLQRPLFCDVCYDDISPFVHASAPSTSLLTCQHYVCDSCWSQHIHVRLHEGFVRLTCPGSECQEEVEAGALLALAPLHTVEKLLLRQEEVRVDASQTEKWCPNELCGRVISLLPSPSGGELQLQQDVVCECGTHVCFQCLTPAHWPASCKQTDVYRASLASAVATDIATDRWSEVHDGFEAEVNEDFKAEEEAKQTLDREKKITLVQGKHCPSCKSFVAKNGGCPQMMCRCGQLFCWFCARPGGAHYERVCVSKEQEKERTTTVVVHHLEYEKHPDGTKEQQLPLSGYRRRRTSLRQRAVKHRQDREEKQNDHAVASLAKAVRAATAKNTTLTQHITRTCLGAELFPSSSAESKEDSATDMSTRVCKPSVLGMVSAFLKDAAQSRKEVLEVVEYSLVLLKDFPDSFLRRRALRISEDLGAFCSYSQFIFDVWDSDESSQVPLQEAVKAVVRLAEIRGWIHAAIDAHLVIFRKLRGLHLHGQ